MRQPWLRRGGWAPALTAERWWRFLRAMLPTPPSAHAPSHSGPDFLCRFAGHPALGGALGDVVGIGGRCVVHCCAVLCRAVLCCAVLCCVLHCASAERAMCGMPCHSRMPCCCRIPCQSKKGCGLVLGQEGRREGRLDRVMGWF